MPKFTMVEPSKPWKPYEPEPPKKYIEHCKSVLPLIREHGTISLKDLKVKTPGWKDLNDLRFACRERDNGCEAYSELDIYYIWTEENAKYEEQMEEYKRRLFLYQQRLQQYREDMARYRKSLKEYIDWCRDNNRGSACYLSRLENELLER